jgi:2-polyprenyl-3-methyl-5-hydroxy-6-metoxy-1,4-benzoquinol methylase
VSNNKQNWLADELEVVSDCLYCATSVQSGKTIKSEDWAFKVASGEWAHVECKHCGSLMLNPRPKENYIKKAYANYYTHESKETIVEKVKERVINSFISRLSKKYIEPSFKIEFLNSATAFLFSRNIAISKDWLFLINSEIKGKFIDIGCGSGRVVGLAHDLGWDAIGLESDPKAIQSATTKKLNVIHGYANDISNFKNYFDCIYCSHVIEHIYNPVNFIKNAFDALKPGGTFILITPNANSSLRHYFGRYWRGLEAPRHIGIASKNVLKKILTQNNFCVDDFSDGLLETARESFGILARELYDYNKQYSEDASKKILSKHMVIKNNQEDIIKFICTKNAL